eukprot:CAMPEP_0194329058 /NCGR_PEP_ID=MMETSP0171-20130528/46873_1 /TAXON_ID=218684 /ORGANISM="Corethron pennatum, Strain L29A3" /LENGTH=273 /DNA_ID=CAMNT_0039089647 /DNA_START=313 /DNA_END=1130 /DNA_ORIENTATION=-
MNVACRFDPVVNELWQADGDTGPNGVGGGIAVTTGVGAEPVHHGFFKGGKKIGIESVWDGVPCAPSPDRRTVLQEPAQHAPYPPVHGPPVRRTRTLPVHGSRVCAGSRRRPPGSKFLATPHVGSELRECPARCSSPAQFLVVVDVFVVFQINSDAPLVAQISRQGRYIIVSTASLFAAARGDCFEDFGSAAADVREPAKGGGTGGETQQGSGGAYGGDSGGDVSRRSDVAREPGGGVPRQARRGVTRQGGRDVSGGEGGDGRGVTDEGGRGGT